MAQTANKEATIQTLRGRLTAFYEYFIDSGDVENSQKIKQLAKKLENREYMIAFCGHFSAGKSTMINKVVGENLLPSSPIPTSANLVKVRSGDDYAKVYFYNEKPRIYLAPYDYELVKKYCKDGDQIKEIEISHANSKLPENTIIMDTPGIDSADDAHRIATESALHLADIVLYVMDYNHVQSEVNFLFTKQLVESGKELYLVINQMDKHKEEEISFDNFKKSVIHSFASWGVYPESVFYTSMKTEEIPYNQFTDLQRLIWSKLKTKDEIVFDTIFHSLQKISDHHFEELRKRSEINLQSSLHLLNELSEDEKINMYERFRQTKRGIKEREQQLHVIEKEFDYEITQILKNAYLMPFQTRALAEAYIEARQPGFKVGFIFSAKKTEQERESRLKLFYDDLLDKIKSQLEWHIRAYFLSLIKNKNLNHPKLVEKAQSFSIIFPIEVLADTIKTGARLSGDYVLQYTEEISNKIKKIARSHLIEFKERYLKTFKEEIYLQNESDQKELLKMEKYVQAFGKIKQNEENLTEAKKSLQKLLYQQVKIETLSFQSLIQEFEEYEVIQDGNFSIDDKKSKPKESLFTQIEMNSKTVVVGEEPLKKAALQLKNASNLIFSLPGFKGMSKDLEEKAARLENKGFTIALFGAFSAGKSSFANALLGDKILPVSPNPTTAAINLIKPVDPLHPHGSVFVKFKDKKDLINSINGSLQLFDLTCDDFEEAFKKISEIKPQIEQEGPAEKTHLSFLRALQKGYPILKDNLGKVLVTDISQFQEFVAEEEKSCFVDWIELYYDCALTRKGISLVDTPGADSINARHTGVAFDFIKNSDAILFVTYYNHAFSKADREFLIQLGRVKDSFHLDKMFFIINAVDLAENDKDKEIVMEYVHEQLTKYGIRNPQLFPVSSLLAIKEKIKGKKLNSGMETFESAFYPFITNDLTEMVLSSAKKELNRVVGLIEKLIENTNENNAVKEHKRIKLFEQSVYIVDILKKQNVSLIQNRLLQEAGELVYYIKQRVFLRFSDFFKEAFNPSLLRDDGRNLKKALDFALYELLESIGYDFAQEMRATIIRIDRFFEKIIEEYQLELIGKIKKENQDLSFSIFDYKNEEEIHFESAFKDIDKQLFNKAMSYFKNPKVFFEKNEKKKMSDELLQLLRISADDYLEKELERVKDFYKVSSGKAFESLLSLMEKQVKDQTLSMTTALTGELSVEMLSSILEKLKKVE